LICNIVDCGRFVFRLNGAAEEFLEQLRPIFDALRQREELPCSYPLHVGSTHGTKQAFVYSHSRTSNTSYHHHYHQQHWVKLSEYHHSHCNIASFCYLFPTMCLYVNCLRFRTTETHPVYIILLRIVF